MISSQVLQTAIDELKEITRVDLWIMDLEGHTLLSTFTDENIPADAVKLFADSVADSQVIQGYHFFKILDDKSLEYVLVSKGSGEDAYMIGRVAVSEIQNLLAAYKERVDNMLLVDIYNRAKKLHIEVEAPRVVFIIETRREKDNIAMETLKTLFASRTGDYITAVDEKSIILVREVEENESYGDLEAAAQMMRDMLNSEAMSAVHISYGTIVEQINQVSKSYKEIFYSEKDIIAYNTLGIGRLIYQLPVQLCEMFMKEVFGENLPDTFDDETLVTISKFFENNLNVSETARQLYVHRNTLVYRLEKLQRSTGLDIRVFDDALTFKIALMVVSYMNYMKNQEY